jgi:prepilin-type N-terminal cleavage/methylation domain-containing protein
MNRKLFLNHAAPAFTIIEILVVVSIIGLLAGLALPAIQGAMNTAKKGKAKAEMQSIITALKAYQNEYGRLPDPVKLGGAGDGYFGENASPRLFLMLAGSSADTSGENPRQIAFLELPANSTNGNFPDPFKLKKNYIVKIDDNGDNVVNYYEDRNGIAVVVSFGPNGNQDDPTSKTSDDVYSFK